MPCGRTPLTDLRWATNTMYILDFCKVFLGVDFSIFCRRGWKLKIGGCIILVVTSMRKKSSLKNINFFLSKNFPSKKFQFFCVKIIDFLRILLRVYK